ncbi:MAG: glycosyltransferase [bacterium]|nr:glycosyltransferase [bacterium]
MELSIIIPVYNEENRLPRTLTQIFEYMSANYSGEYEVIIANDGSKDQTAAIVEESKKIHPQLRLINFPVNRGRGAAVRDTVFEAKGEFILETDGDGSTNEHAITAFLNYFANNPEVDMLIGSRTIEGAKILTPQPLLRVALGYCFLFMAHILFGWKLIDRVNGFKMFRRTAALDIFSNQYDNSFLAEGEIVFVAEARGWRVKELPIQWTDYRGSKINSLRDSWHSFFGMFTILQRHRQGLYTKNLKNQ